MFANLTKIAKIESLLREDVVKVLRLHRQELNKLEWCFEGKPLEADKLHIEQNVITERIKERPKNLRNDSADSEGLKTQSSILEITGQATLYELSARTSEREQARWSNVTGKADLRLAIIGAPGSGKSFTTRYTVIEKIDKALKLSRERLCQLSDIEFPLWTTASELAAQNTDQPEKAVTAIIRARFHKFRLSPQFYQWFERKLNFVFEQSSSEDYFSESKILFLVVDSLDELADDQRKDFQNLAKNLDKPSLRLIVTCRTLQWEVRSNWLGFTPKEKVEIAPLNFSQQQKLSDGFFQNRSDLRTKMHYLLEGNRALRYAMTTPLLLTFGCLLNGDHDLNKSTSYVEIYASVVSKIFVGDWRDGEQKPYWANNDVCIDTHLGLLDKICWEIFNRNPELNLFTLDDWKKAYQNTKLDVEEKKISYGEFLTALEKLGFISKAGVKNGSRQWSFTHRTFLEFLAARALAKRNGWIEIARQHFWFAPEWLECLTFLAGLIDIENARKLIQALREEEDDIFGSMIFLEARFVGASQFIEEKDIEFICERIIHGLRKIGDFNNRIIHNVAAIGKQKLEHSISSSSEIIGDKTIYIRFLEPALFAVQLNLSAEKYFFENVFSPLLEFMKSENHFVLRGLAAHALGFLGNARVEIYTALHNCFKSDDEDFVRGCAAEALGWLGNPVPEIITTLLEYSKSRWEKKTGLAVLNALSRFTKERPEIIMTFLEELRVGTTKAQFVAVKTLSRNSASDPNIIAALIECAGPKTGLHARFFAVEALVELVDPPQEVLNFLLNNLEKDNGFYADRQQCAAILGKLRNASAPVIAALFKVVKYEKDDERVRISAAEALVSLSETNIEIIPALTNCLKTSNREKVRIAVATAFSKLNIVNAEVSEALLECFNSNAEGLLRLNAALALGQQGNPTPEVVDALIKYHQKDHNHNIHERCATALYNISHKNKTQLEEDIQRKIISLLLQDVDTRYYVLNSSNIDLLYRISEPKIVKLLMILL